MKISKDTVVQFIYQLKDVQGKLLETSDKDEPVLYLHGHNNMIRGLENSMENRSNGEKYSVTLEAKDAYGERVQGSEQRIPVKHLQGAKKWKPGMMGVINTEQGQKQVTVVKSGKFMVTVDNNHPLAGKTLTFDIEILTVREATMEEISHGHAHGVGGHQH